MGVGGSSSSAPLFPPPNTEAFHVHSAGAVFSLSFPFPPFRFWLFLPERPIGSVFPFPYLRVAASCGGAGNSFRKPTPGCALSGGFCRLPFPQGKGRSTVQSWAGGSQGGQARVRGAGAEMPANGRCARGEPACPGRQGTRRLFVFKGVPRGCWRDSPRTPASGRGHGIVGGAPRAGSIRSAASRSAPGRAHCRGGVISMPGLRLGLRTPKADRPPSWVAGRRRAWLAEPRCPPPGKTRNQN